MSGDTILIAVISSLPGLIALVGILRKDMATAKKTGSEREQLEDEITERVLKRAAAEIEKYQAKIIALETQLDAANTLIGELLDRDKKREAAMIALQKQFDNDTLLRANIEKALALANEKIAVLEISVKERDEIIARLQVDVSERDQVIIHLQSQIDVLQNKQSGFGVRNA